MTMLAQLLQKIADEKGCRSPLSPTIWLWGKDVTNELREDAELRFEGKINRRRVYSAAPLID